MWNDFHKRCPGNLYAELTNVAAYFWRTALRERLRPVDDP